MTQYNSTLPFYLLSRIYCRAECHYAECRYAKCRYAEYCYAECRYAECHYVECRYAECRGALQGLANPVNSIL
jgi:hypothetical protein